MSVAEQVDTHIVLKVLRCGMSYSSMMILLQWNL